MMAYSAMRAAAIERGVCHNAWLKRLFCHIGAMYRLEAWLGKQAS